ncbi:MAG: hypothetical protein A2W90_03880 [Bacteroidetes bacterium GWF2_42_66]|nr:MAG: hypothetical protein A2W92_18795 [Bacteroidetes bacterium GWA2_42_15]OFY02535.1 MAG: hypothetical protein A2W89_21975 [Bacteroidetes bacterium GWE2_42_39]OFY41367.1 MAG: hypothetical protein A2W90_03880 [Bacteroidetes bacterium GWF2_42_66]HBL75433.1 hypothetical protein [Prolixibacteraceae bacterium]HCR91446.1 hypothetical protein [Prolixibacteraceae bacterium]
MKFVLIGIALLSGLFALGQDEKVENYLWSYTSLSEDINEKTQIVFSEKVHYNLSEKLSDYNQFDIILYRDIHKNFSVGLALRNAYSGGRNNWVSEITPQIYGVYKGSLNKFSINWSNRIDFQNFDTGAKRTRYRNKLTVIFPRSYTKLKISPFLAEEMFVKFNDDGFYNFRLFGGAYLFDIRFLKANLFYCYNMINKENRWTHQNVTGISLHFKI